MYTKTGLYQIENLELRPGSFDYKEIFEFLSIAFELADSAALILQEDGGDDCWLILTDIIHWSDPGNVLRLKCRPGLCFVGRHYPEWCNTTGEDRKSGRYKCSGIPASSSCWELDSGLEINSQYPMIVSQLSAARIKNLFDNFSMRSQKDQVVQKINLRKLERMKRGKTTKPAEADAMREMVVAATDFIDGLKETFGWSAAGAEKLYDISQRGLRSKSARDIPVERDGCCRLSGDLLAEEGAHVVAVVVAESCFSSREKQIVTKEREKWLLDSKKPVTTQMRKILISRNAVGAIDANSPENIFSLRADLYTLYNRFAWSFNRVRRSHCTKIFLAR